MHPQWSCRHVQCSTVLVDAALDFRTEGSCNAHHLGKYQAWLCGEFGTVVVDGKTIKAAELTKMAVMICQSCPVQYRCARFAIESGEEWGTWAMRRRNLNWLIGFEMTEEQRPVTTREAIALIDEAELAGTPVEIFVRGEISRRRKQALVTSAA